MSFSVKFLDNNCGSADINKWYHALATQHYWYNELIVSLSIFMGFDDNKINIEYDQPYPSCKLIYSVPNKVWFQSHT